ncbi:hypothetical protein ACVW17_000293 [Bradyrhizobium sp. USDA 4473]
MKREPSHKQFTQPLGPRSMDPCFRRDDIEYVERNPYASPSVSNIAAAIASVVDLPAHTTNWNAG